MPPLRPPNPLSFGGSLRKIWFKLSILLAATAFTVACGGGAFTAPQPVTQSATSSAANVATTTSNASVAPPTTSSSTPTTGVPTPPALGPASSGTTVELDQLSGWQSCDTCAGPGGAGPTAPHSLTQGVVSPSLDGASTQFWMGGSTPYSDVLWYKKVLVENQVATNHTVHHFIYDLYFYTDNAAAAQSVEWDVNQFVDGRSYIFGSQCSYRAGDTWDIWDNVHSKWVSTGVSCGALQSNTWNHVVLEFERTSDDQLHYIAMTLNGTRHYLNWYYPSTATTWSGVTVNYQMDGNFQQANYSTWVDKMILNYW
jgi:hypothetical protein